MSYFQKFKGQSAALPLKTSLKQIAFVWLGALIASCVLGGLAYYSKQPLVMGSFGASIFVLFILPDTPQHNLETLLAVTFCRLSWGCFSFILLGLNGGVWHCLWRLL
jgi:hypothetical protein